MANNPFKDRRTAVLLPVLVFLAAACSSLPPTTSYYVGDGNLQYFVRASTFQDSQGNKFLPDFSYRRDGSAVRKVGITMSFRPSGRHELEIPQVVFRHESTGRLLEVEDESLLFREKRDNHLRFQGQLKENDFLELMEAGPWTVELRWEGGTALQFPPSQEFAYHLTYLKEEL